MSANQDPHHPLAPPWRSDAGSVEGFVGIDALALPAVFSGAAYYIYHLTKSLLETSRPFPIAVFCRPQHRPLFAGLLRPGDKIIPVPLERRAARLYFYEFKLKSLLIKENIRVFYATHYICPAADARYYLVSAFHDMGFLLFPRFYPLLKRLYFGRRMRTFLSRSDRVVAISRSTAAAIGSLFPEYAPRVAVIYPGTDHLLDADAPAPLSPRVEPPFILAVNTFEVRKNIPFIIRLFNHLKSTRRLAHRLLVVGQPANGYKKILAEIRRSPFRRDIVLASAIPAEELSFYYRHCDFFLNASEYEGFGFTPFEALSHGCPAFLYKNNAVAEFLGDHPYIFEHLEVELWAERIGQEMAASFRGKIAPETIRNLSWQNTARETRQLLEQVISTGEPRLVP